MSGKKWTILLLSGGEDGVKQFGISEKTLRIALASACLFLVTLFGTALALGMGGGQRLRANLLEQENAALSSEIAEIQLQMAELEGALTGLAERGTRFRLMAGLDSLDHDLLRAGVGGPGVTGPEDSEVWSLDPDLGLELFAANVDMKSLARRASLLSESLSEAVDSLRARQEILESMPSLLPAQGYVTSGFSNAREHPIHNEALPHEGIDVTAPLGTPILAAAKGRVVFAGRRTGYGMVVEIDHGYGYMTRYGHASELLVRRGDRIDRGDVIAKVGQTGIATAPHLHYEVHLGGRPLNPLDFLITKVIP